MKFKTRALTTLSVALIMAGCATSSPPPLPEDRPSGEDTSTSYSSLLLDETTFQLGDTFIRPAVLRKEYDFLVKRIPLLARLKVEIRHQGSSERPIVTINGQSAGTLSPHWTDLSSRNYEIFFFDRNTAFSQALDLDEWITADLFISPEKLKLGKNHLTITTARADTSQSDDISLRDIEIEFRYLGPGDTVTDLRSKSKDLILPYLTPGDIHIDGFLNTGRYGMPVVLIDENIYILGGSGKYSRTLTSGEKYDTTLKKSKIITEKLLPRRYHTAESFGGKIYIMGGVTPDPAIKKRVPTKIVEKYDPGSDTVSYLSSLNSPRRTPASVIHDGKIYLIGGSVTGGKRVGTVEIYDIAADTWSRGTSMETPRECEVVLYQDTIYAFGGYDGKDALKSFEAYDIANDKWKRLPDLPFPLSAHHAAVVGDILYTFGDYRDRGMVCQYDFTSGKWKSLDTSYIPSRHNAVVRDDDTIYIIGGNIATSGSHLDYIQSVTASYLAKRPARPTIAPVTAAKKPEQSKLIDLNTASIKELIRLHRVGPETAAKIIAERDENGPFASLADIAKRVRGIGPKTVALWEPDVAYDLPEKTEKKEPPIKKELTVKEEIYAELKEIRKLLEARDGKIVDKSESRPVYGQQARRKPNEEALAKITLPPEPTEKDIQDYVRAIMDVSRKQKSFSEQDPQVEMLTRIGPEYLAILIDSYRLQPRADTYLKEAIINLAQPENKELILKSLPRLPDLIEVVVKKGWVEESRPILINGLNLRLDSLPLEWIEAIASFKDPETYDVLKNYLLHCWNKPMVYEEIKDLPGIDLSDTIARAWERAKYDHEYQSTMMAPVAIEFGHLDALARAVKDIDVDSGPRISNARDLVTRFTTARGSGEEIREWFAANKDRLIFDRERRIFRVQGEETGSEAEVGRRGNPDGFIITGNAGFDREEIIDSLTGEFDFWVQAYPTAPLDAFRNYLRKTLRAAYLHAGFLDCVLEVSLDREKERLLIAIDEGPRYHAFDVEVTGNSAITSEEIIARLTTPYRPREYNYAVHFGAAQPEIIWPLEKPARGDQVTLRACAEAVAELYRDAGYPDARVECRVIAAGDTRARLSVEISGEGEPLTVDQVLINGARIIPEEYLREKLAVKPGARAGGRLIEKIKRILWEMGGYLSYSVETVPVEDGSSRVNLAITLEEYPSARPPSQPLTPEENVLEKTRGWLYRMPEWEKDLVIRCSSRGEELSIEKGTFQGRIEFILSPSNGIIIDGKFDRWGESLKDQSGVFIATADELLYYSPKSRQKISLSGLTGSLNVSVKILPLPEAEEGKYFKFEGGVWYSSTPTDGMPIGFELEITPVCLTAFSAINRENWQWETDEIILKKDGGILRLNGTTGELIDFSCQTGPTRLDIVMEKDAFLNRRRELEETARDYLSIDTGSFWADLLINGWGEMISSSDPELDQQARHTISTVLERNLALFPLKKLLAGEPERERFIIPAEAPPSTEETLESLVNTFEMVARSIPGIAFRFFPYDSWPMLISQFPGYFFSQEKYYLRDSLERIYRSDRVGPLGCLGALSFAFTELAGLPEMRKKLVEKGLQNLNFDSFQIDFDLLSPEKSPQRNILLWAIHAGQGLNPEEFKIIGRALEKSEKPIYFRYLTIIHENPDRTPEEILNLILRVFWDEIGKDKVREKLEEKSESSLLY